MLLVVLTGRIGSGKSTVAAALAQRGAVVVEADPIGRQILEPAGAAYQPVVDRFGAGVVKPDGSIDRSAVAAIVFEDPAALADLNAISHPAIALGMAALVQEASAGGAEVVVLDLALPEIATPDLFDVGAVLLVQAPEEVAVARLVAGRGFSEADARARVAAQREGAERWAGADYIIENSGDRVQLEQEVDEAWAWLLARAGGGGGRRR